MRIPLVVPTKKTGQIEKFVRQLGAEKVAIVPRLPESYGIAGACFGNVDAKIAGLGGSRLMGWAIRIWPKVFIEAEQHCIWLGPHGQLIDVSPHPRDEKLTFFAIDNSLEITAEGVATRTNEYSIVGVGRRRTLAFSMIKAAKKRQQMQLDALTYIDGASVRPLNQAKFNELLDDMKIAVSSLLKITK